MGKTEEWIISRARLKEMYVDKGLTQEEIAQLHGVVQTTVSAKLRALGIETRPDGPPQLELGEEILRYLYWDLGLTLEETATRLRCSRSTVLRRMRDHQVPRRHRGERAERTWENCAACGEVGTWPRNRKSPIRYSGDPFGIKGQICNTCYRRESRRVRG